MSDEEKTRWTFVMDLPLEEGPWTPESARAYVEAHLNEGRFFDSFRVVHAHPFGESNPVKAEELLRDITSEPDHRCGRRGCTEPAVWQEAGVWLCELHAANPMAPVSEEDSEDAYVPSPEEL